VAPLVHGTGVGDRQSDGEGETSNLLQGERSDNANRLVRPFVARDVVVSSELRHRPPAGHKEGKKENSRAFGVRSWKNVGNSVEAAERRMQKVRKQKRSDKKGALVANQLADEVDNLRGTKIALQERIEDLEAEVTKVVDGTTTVAYTAQQARFKSKLEKELLECAQQEMDKQRERDDMERREAQRYAWIRDRHYQWSFAFKEPVYFERHPIVVICRAALALVVAWSLWIMAFNYVPGSIAVLSLITIFGSFAVCVIVSLLERNHWYGVQDVEDDPGLLESDRPISMSLDTLKFADPIRTTMKHNTSVCFVDFLSIFCGAQPHRKEVNEDGQIQPYKPTRLYFETTNEFVYSAELLFQVLIPANTHRSLSEVLVVQNVEATCRRIMAVMFDKAESHENELLHVATTHVAIAWIKHMRQKMQNVYFPKALRAL